MLTIPGIFSPASFELGRGENDMDVLCNHASFHIYCIGSRVGHLALSRQEAGGQDS
jgi:hypothetical protein